VSDRAKGFVLFDCLAQMFASFEGQFYDRMPFDNFARQAHALYEPADADLFRSRLDRRLRDRHSTPVAWGLDRDSLAVEQRVA
jgi:hypothetical protein